MKKLLTLLALITTTLSAYAEIHTENINYQIDDEKFTGYLAYDDTIKTKRPGVLVVHEWWGISDYEKRRARMLAKLGYVAFVVDMYGVGKHTDKPEQAKTWMQSVTTDTEWWRERAMKGVDILRKNPLVSADNIAAIGYCFGGGTVIQMAYGGADLDGVVSFHGSLPIANNEEIKAIKTKLLILHGSADPFVSDETVKKFQDQLETANIDWQMMYYGGKRHSFTVPEAGDHGMEALKYDADADRRSWAAMQSFLKEVFSDQP